MRESYVRILRISVREVQRAARLGAAGFLVWGSPPETVPPFGSPIYDPLWEAAASAGLPVSLHCITSGQPQVRSRSAYVQYLDVIHDVQRSLAEIVCGGVLQRSQDSLWFRPRTIADGSRVSFSGSIPLTRSLVSSPHVR